MFTLGDSMTESADPAGILRARTETAPVAGTPWIVRVRQPDLINLRHRGGEVSECGHHHIELDNKNWQSAAG